MNSPSEGAVVRALIIDDSKAMRSILGRMLRGLDFEVVEAANGREALERLQASERSISPWWIGTCRK